MPPQHLPGQRIGLLLVLYDDPAVDQHMYDAPGELMGIQVGGFVDDKPGVKNDNVRPHAGLNQSSVRQTQPLGRGSGQVPDHFLQRKQAEISPIL